MIQENNKNMLKFWQIARIQKTRGELLIYSLINTHQRILALLEEFPQMTYTTIFAVLPVKWLKRIIPPVTK